MNRLPYNQLFTICAIGVAFTVLPGCGKPALRMELSCDPAKIFPNQPIPLKIALSAHGGTVYLASDYRSDYKIDVILTDETGSIQTTVLQKGVVCGTGAAVLLPLYPARIAFALFDVLDLSGRYLLLKDGETRQDPIYLSLLAPKEPNPLWVFHKASLASSQKHLWRPGTYRIKVSLANELGALPPPFFWSPYDQPVEAEITVTMPAEKRTSPPVSQASPTQ